MNERIKFVREQRARDEKSNSSIVIIIHPNEHHQSYSTILLYEYFGIQILKVLFIFECFFRWKNNNNNNKHRFDHNEILSDSQSAHTESANDWNGNANDKAPSVFKLVRQRCCSSNINPYNFVALNSNEYLS